MKHTNLIQKLTAPLIAVLLPALLPAQGGIGLLRIGNGANLVMTGPVNLVLNDVTFTNDGNFSPGSSQVVFTGIKTTLVGGTHFSGFNNFTPNKSSNNVKLAQHITVLGNLTMTRGNVNLNGFDINLGGSGTIINERNGSSILGPTGGNVVATRFFTPNVALNPGNIGAQLMITNSPGETLTFQRRHIPLTLASTGNPSIERSFTIMSGINAPLNYNLSFFYLDGELNGNDESLLNLYAINGADLSQIGSDGTDAGNNFVVKNGLGQLGSFTLASEAGGPPPPPSSIVRKATSGGIDVAEGNPSIQIFPNPSRNIFNIQLMSNVEKNISFSLVDQSGQILQQKKIHCYQGSNVIPWDMSKYAAGVYFIRVENMGLKNIRIVRE